MSGKLSKILSILLYALLGLSAILGVVFYATGSTNAQTLIAWCYILLGIATAAAIVFPILGMAKNPKAAKSALIGVGALVVVLGISYGLADSEITPKIEKFISGPFESRLVSTGLIAFYILAAVAVLTTLSSGIFKLIKK